MPTIKICASAFALACALAGMAPSASAQARVITLDEALVRGQEASPLLNAAREQAVRRLRDRVGADRLRDPGGLALEHRACRLGCDVASGEPGPAGGEDERRLARKLHDRRRDLLSLVGYQAAIDFVTIGTK